MIESTELSSSLAEGFLQRLPTIAWRVKLEPDGDLSWHGMTDGEKIAEATEPQTSGWERFKAWFLKIAPESQL